MQFYRFIFLSRSWAADRLHLANSLAWLGREAQTKHTPLTFILYPEGTLVSKDTRPISKKFADKLGIVSTSNMSLDSLLIILDSLTCGTRYYRDPLVYTTPYAHFHPAFLAYN